MPRRIRPFHKARADRKDPRFQHDSITALINVVMVDGKKHTASGIVYAGIENAAAQLKKEPVAVYEQALENIMPLVEVKAKRVGGANYQVPTEIPTARRHALALRWLVQAARKRKGGTMGDHLKQELLDAYNNTGSVVKKKEEVHKMAEANKALAHFSKF